MGGAWLELLAVEAQSLAVSSSFFVLLEYGPMVQVSEIFRLQGDRGSAGMVEQEESEFELFVMDLVAYEADIRIRKKKAAVTPFEAAA